MARHCHSESIARTPETSAEVRPEGFMSLAEVDALIKSLNRKQRQLSRHRTVRSVKDIRHLSPEELGRLAWLIAGRQNRRVD